MSTPNDPLLEVNALNVTFPGGVKAVRGIDLLVAHGEVLGIVGESGSGKSTAALAMLGLLPSTAETTGSVRLKGTNLLELDDKGLSELRGDRISMVFQDPLSALTPVYTIGDQIAEAILIHRDVTKEAAAKRTIELLEIVGIPDAAGRAKAFPHEFSGGMRQRVMIAMAIANDPDVIVCDEPTTALDVTIQAQVLDALDTARKATHASIVLITHDLSVVAGFADRVAVMYAGRIVEAGTVEELFYRPRMPYTMGLLGAIPRLDDQESRPLIPIEGSPPSLVDLPPGCPFAPRCPLVVDICRTTEPPLAAVAGGSQLAACHRSGHITEHNLTPVDVFPVPEIGEPPLAGKPRGERTSVLEADNLKRHFPLLKGAIFKRRVGTVKAVDGISLDIREGETLGLVGESGCGKTTTLLEVLELQTPEAGRVVILGRDTAGLDKKGKRDLRRDLSVVFQDPLASLDPRMPIQDVIAEPMRTHGMSSRDIKKRVKELLALVGLDPDHAERYPQQFSGGQRQRIGIARALALDPKLIVLDEPVSALDVSIQAGIINLLEELRARLGLSYLFVAHDLAVVRHIADRVAVMYLGRIAEIGEVNAVYEAPAHPYTQALLSAIPLPDPRLERRRERIVLEGDLPSPANPPSGCRFRTRCQKFAGLDMEQQAKCINEEPELSQLETDHSAACHYAEKLDVVHA
jgi:peptide/nickel transport system ATP-binding protein